MEGLQGQPTALSVEAQLQALGRRMLLAATRCPPRAPPTTTLPGTFRAQCSFLQCCTEGTCGPAAAVSTAKV